jgi:hypothetical protein
LDNNPTTEQPEWQLQAPEIGPEVGMPAKLFQLRQKLNWKAKQEPNVTRRDSFPRSSSKLSE